MQYAWLERDRGLWRLFSKMIKEEKRRWDNEDLALKELQEEGWSVSALYLLKHESRFHAYGLNRRVH